MNPKTKVYSSYRRTQPRRIDGTFMRQIRRKRINEKLAGCIIIFLLTIVVGYVWAARAEYIDTYMNQTMEVKTNEQIRAEAIEAKMHDAGMIELFRALAWLEASLDMSDPEYTAALENYQNVREVRLAQYGLSE